MYAVKVILKYKSVHETLVCDHSNDSYWAVLSCGTVLYKVVLTIKSLDETQVCDHSNESYWANFLVILFIISFNSTFVCTLDCSKVSDGLQT